MTHYRPGSLTLSLAALTLSGLALPGTTSAAAAAADVAAGQKVAQACMICHNFDKGGPNKIGPNLYGIVGRPVASKAGYTYSAAMKKKGGTWDAASLDVYLTSPMTTVPGTKMTFAGVKTPRDRANLIAWLKTLK